MSEVFTFHDGEKRFEVRLRREEDNSFIAIIKDENMRMNQQVEKVLQMSTLERHELFLQPGVLSLHSIITSIVKSFS